ncbi:MAG: SUMF1/EgtB/PvdO family nonheme iron enzyme [Verrucomicrobiae bacterium]|nr:SUMF1/EgtB/PvdO family nonheme iron enzyme [Verrucomicrobiae bacterium]
MKTSSSHTHPYPEYPTRLLVVASGPIKPPIVFGAYELQSLVRRSNMSLLCRGIRLGTQEAVAVKICLPGADRPRFQREIQHTQSIRSHGVIKVQDEDVGVAKDGCPYYATRWIDGPSLAERLADPRVPVEARLEVVEELCRIVGLLHEKGVRHRDLKPSNAMLEDGGRKVVLLDLGLARADHDTDLTATGAAAGGTPGYMPPWVVEHPEWVEDYQRQWDVHSLGVILVEALTGERPKGPRDPRFTADGVAGLLKDKLPKDRRFDALATACLASDPRNPECPRDADDLYNRLRACRGLRGRGSGARWVVRAGVGLAMALGIGALGMAVAFPEAWHEWGDRIRGLASAWVAGTGGSPAVEDSPMQEAALHPLIIPNPSLSQRLLRVRVWPEGATVRVVDHQANGGVLAERQAPASGELEFDLPEDPEAQYGLVVFKPGYQVNQQRIRAGSDTEVIDVQVHLDRLRGEVLLKSNPGARLTLTDAAGASRTVGPVESGGELLVRSLEEGDWVFRIDLADHAPATGRITRLVQGRQHLLDRPLAPLPGRLSVVGHPTMAIWMGENRLQPSNGWMELPAGVHDLQLRRPGFRSEMLRVEIPPNRAVSRVAPEFTAEAEVVEKQTLPADLVAVADARPAPLEGLYAGSREAQQRQIAAAQAASLPLEVRTAQFDIALRFVPGGTFQMGSPANEEGRGLDESTRQVTLSRAVYVGKYPVTQSVWQAVMWGNARTSLVSRVMDHDESIWQAMKGSNPSHFKTTGGAGPVEMVSWNDAQEFINQLCNRLRVPRGTYRLLTEAEWEYACRAGTTGPAYGPLDQIAWYDANSGRTTHPVGGKQANAFGLHDMLGNVWEWCSDWHGAYLTGAEIDPSGPGGGWLRVSRGGSRIGRFWWSSESSIASFDSAAWSSESSIGSAACSRSASRRRLAPGVRSPFLGFRLARAIP